MYLQFKNWERSQNCTANGTLESYLQAVVFLGSKCLAFSGSAPGRSVIRVLLMKLEDIAQKAGVSRSTVSRVINNDRYVGEKTRRRVLQVIEQEQFQPNPAARALVTRRTHIIGVAIPQTTNVFYGDNSYFPMLLQGIAESVNRQDYAMLLWLAEHHEIRDGFAARVARHRQNDGLIITSIIEHDPLFEHLVKHKRCFVMVETPPAHREEVSFVSVNNVAAAEEAVNHLIRIGRRRIATITGQLNIRDAIDRLQGYKNALRNAGMPIEEQLIIPGRFSRESGLEGIRALMDKPIDALFAGGDQIAVGAMDFLREMGIRVPDDIAVVGFDDLDVAARYELTTIRHAVQEVGSNAAQLLINLIEGRLEHPQHVYLPTELIIRSSTDPVGKGGA